MTSGDESLLTQDVVHRSRRVRLIELHIHEVVGLVADHDRPSSRRRSAGQ